VPNAVFVFRHAPQIYVCPKSQSNQTAWRETFWFSRRGGQAIGGEQAKKRVRGPVLKTARLYIRRVLPERTNDPWLPNPLASAKTGCG